VNPYRVLIADDDPDYLRLMSGHLRKRGYEVETAENGVQALERMGKSPTFDVLVTDLMMPGMDGYELLRSARALDPRIEVVVISGVGSLESAISSMRENGAYDYLTKPLEKVTDLSLAVERAASHRQLVVERERLQAQIEEERHRLHNLVANASDAILSADAQDIITVANPQATRLLGNDSLVGQRAVLCLPPPLAILLEHWRSSDPSQPMVSEIPWPADCVNLASLAPATVDNGAGNSGWVMVVQDITHLKQMDGVKMRLLSEAAEHIRSPLASAFEALLELNDLPESATEGFTLRMEALVGQLSAIRHWTDDLFALTAIEADIDQHPQPIEVNVAVGRWKGSVAADDLRSRGYKLALHMAADSPRVLADPATLQILLDCMMAQAAWRASAGTAIEMTARQEQGQVWLEVCDQGPSIHETELPRFFAEVFAETADRRGGTGLELAMVKTIVDRLGGQVWVSALQPTGNRLAVSLPPAEA
jgi:CheY-like chemotaxis protein